MNQQNCYYLFNAIFSLPGKAKEYHVSMKKFENSYLILAREAAFEYYDNFVHGLLLGQGLTEREAGEMTDRGIRELLDAYIDPKTFSEITYGSDENEIKHTMPDYMGNVISVSLIIENGEKNEFTIHSIRKDTSTMPYPVNYYNLECEYDYYKENNLSTEDYVTTINYFDVDEFEEGFEETALGTHVILRTPFDWTDYDKKGWWLQ